MDIDKKLQQIEALRLELNKLGKDRTYYSKELVEKSQELDRLLITYLKMLKRE